MIIGYKSLREFAEKVNMNYSTVRYHMQRGFCTIKNPTTKHPLFSTWSNMKTRCYGKNNKDYQNYGGRGITICNQWKVDFRQFVKDMGPKPTPNHTIERIDNNKGYSKDNCIWATRKEQAANRRPKGGVS